MIGGGVTELPGLFPLLRAELTATLAGYPGLPEHAAEDFVVPARLGRLAARQVDWSWRPEPPPQHGHGRRPGVGRRRDRMHEDGPGPGRLAGVTSPDRAASSTRPPTPG